MKKFEAEQFELFEYCPDCQREHSFREICPKLLKSANDFLVKMEQKPIEPLIPWEHSSKN